MCHYFAKDHGDWFKHYIKKYKLTKELKELLKKEKKYIKIYSVI